MYKFKIGDKVKLKKCEMELGHCLDTVRRFEKEETGTIVGYYTANRFVIEFKDGYRGTCSANEIEIIDTFSLKDLKAGYVTKSKDGFLRMIMPTASYGLVLIGESTCWSALTDLNSDLTFKNRSLQGIDIVEVYGYSEYATLSLDINTNSRKLLWKRKEEKTLDLTIQDIEKVYGCKVNIINKEEK